MLEPLVARLPVDSSGRFDPLVRQAFEENPMVQCTLSFQHFRGKFSSAVCPFVQMLRGESSGAVDPCVQMIFWGESGGSLYPVVKRPLWENHRYSLPFCLSFRETPVVQFTLPVQWPEAPASRPGNMEKLVAMIIEGLASLRIGVLHWQPPKPGMCCYRQVVHVKTLMPPLISASLPLLYHNVAKLAP